MSKETYMEVRENLKYIYTIVNNIINSYERHNENLATKQTNEFMTETIIRLGEVSSILQIDIHRLDMIFSINNINSKVNYKTQ